VILTRFVRLLLPAALPVLVSACGSGRLMSGGTGRPGVGRPTPSPGGVPQATVTLVQIQEQIFTPHCASCHAAGGSGPMPLTDPATSYASLVGVDPINSTARQAGKKRVVPGDPSRSFLMDKITGAMMFGEGDPMPQNGERLSADEIALIRRWIQAGAPSGLTSSSPGPASWGSSWRNQQKSRGDSNRDFDRSARQVGRGLENALGLSPRPGALLRSLAPGSRLDGRPNG
jgi:mono/diheme cytochrome c family protein